MKRTFYNTQQIVNFMQQEYRGYVDGYKRLDNQGLLLAALAELRAPFDGVVPTEFEVALSEIEAQHKKNGGTL